MASRQTKYRKLIPVLLISLLIALSGCTIIGHNIGAGLDRTFTDMDLAEFGSDTCSCAVGDRVLISFKSGQSLEGQIKTISVGDSLSVLVLQPKTTDYRYKRIANIPWQSIHSMSEVNMPEFGRLIFTALGLALDVWIFNELNEASRGPVVLTQ